MTLLTRRTVAAMFLLIWSVASNAGAQTPAPAQKPPSENPLVAPVRVQVVVARYQGEKRVSSLPYTLFANVANRGLAQVRMGAEIPIATVTPPPAGDGRAAPAPSVNYERIGTEIDCAVRSSGDARFFVELTISDRTIYADDEKPRLATPSMSPTLRSFRSYNTLVLKDGQSTQFAAAADRITGEVVRVEVTLHTVK